MMSDWDKIILLMIHHANVNGCTKERCENIRQRALEHCQSAEQLRLLIRNSYTVVTRSQSSIHCQIEEQVRQEKHLLRRLRDLLEISQRADKCFDEMKHAMINE